MTITRTLPAVGTHTATPHSAPPRDITIDAIRAACLLVVVVLHSLMVGVEIAPGGGLRTSVALSGEAWFAPITWILQIMPLFFIAGGFAALSQWRQMRTRGATAAQYIAGRVQRLAVPAVLMIFVVGGVLLLAKMLGAEPALIHEASLRIGQPLWFLAVYLGVTALVPTMAWLHERFPLVTIAALGLGVVAVDVANSLLAAPVGYLNLALVWPLMQQLGFAMLDGACAAWSRRKLLTGMLSALSLLLVLISLGWSSDMLFNLNPPTMAIALLGIAQFFALQLLRPRLDAATVKPVVARLAAKAGTYAMAIYLWHMPVILLLVSFLWVAGIPLPEPHSFPWWASRIPWLAMIAACVIPFAVLVSRCEKRIQHVVSTGATHASSTSFTPRSRAVLCVLLSIAGTATALLAGIATPIPFFSAIILLSGSVALATSLVGVNPRTKQLDGNTFRPESWSDAAGSCA